jgi:hypothetical protein
MHEVWKYHVPIQLSPFAHDMPAGAEVLCVQDQRGQKMMWAKVNPKADSVPRYFRWLTTGQPSQTSLNAKYVGTVQDGDFVFHLFEIIP